MIKTIVIVVILAIFILTIVPSAFTSFVDTRFQNLETMSDENLTAEWERIKKSSRKSEAAGSHYFLSVKKEVERRGLNS